jgi:hypothetical protein
MRSSPYRNPLRWFRLKIREKSMVGRIIPAPPWSAELVENGPATRDGAWADAQDAQSRRRLPRVLGCPPCVRQFLKPEERRL